MHNTQLSLFFVVCLLRKEPLFVCLKADDRLASNINVFSLYKNKILKCRCDNM